MSKSPLKLSSLVADMRLAPESPLFSQTTRSGIAVLASPDTLRFTISHSRSESFWHLMHSAGAPEYKEQSIAPSARLRSISKTMEHAKTATDLQIRPRSRSILVPSLSRKIKALPTDRDYRRLHNRLDKIIHGSALSFRSMTLSETKPAELTLDSGEWQYLKIKTQSMQIPMKIAMRRSKGKVVCYLSRTAQEPNEIFFDEMHTKDDFLFSEAGLRFKSPWIFLGLKCTEEAALVVTVRFGIRRQKRIQLTRVPTLADLSELRRDDEKRKALNQAVDTVLAIRQEEWRRKYRTKDFIRANKELNLKNITLKKEMERLKMLETLKRAHDLLKQRKEKAEEGLRKQERRREILAFKQARAEELRKVEGVQKTWLTFSFLYAATVKLSEVYFERKRDLQRGFRMVASAKMIQRCYRRMHLYIHPKRITGQRILHHLRLFMGLFGPVTKMECRQTIFTVIRTSAKPKILKKKMDALYSRGNRHTVLTIQAAWRQYHGVKQKRLEALLKSWGEALATLLASFTHGSAKKNAKKIKEAEQKYQQLNARNILREYFRNCERRFYQEIKAWKTASIQRKRDTVFTTQTEEVSVTPKFRWQMTPEEMQQLIQSSLGEPS